MFAALWLLGDKMLQTSEAETVHEETRAVHDHATDSGAIAVSTRANPH
jgi:hypothetical protein|tara:strand:+ start:128 stop:271 length:144 start_codon:yes stop_codon:yes gene_type:complete